MSKTAVSLVEVNSDFNSKLAKAGTAYPNVFVSLKRGSNKRFVTLPTHYQASTALWLADIQSAVEKIDGLTGMQVVAVTVSLAADQTASVPSDPPGKLSIKTISYKAVKKSDPAFSCILNVRIPEYKLFTGSDEDNLLNLIKLDVCGKIYGDDDTLLIPLG